ncbi:MAG: tRNA 2-thiouridine(34) synthase MnmA [Syntrophorhabdaceae bacterium]
MQNVFVAMSGGFDSFMSAYLLKKAGFKVTGITFSLMPLNFFSKNEFDGICENPAKKAAALCESLSIAHHVIDLSAVFLDKVIQPFIEGYRAGTTPNPCVACNRYVKFQAFLGEALARGADMIATGHYATIRIKDGNIALAKARDRSKDQSYFLWAVDKEALARTILPLSGHTKDELRIFARQEGIRFPESAESQDVCFIPDGRTGYFLSHFIKSRKGKVYLTDGTMIGWHEGTHFYTVGQRRGLNIPYREPLYVVEIRADENVIIAGSKTDLMQRKVVARSVRILSFANAPVCARVRYRQPEKPCAFTVAGDRLSIVFDNPIEAATPGQSAVVYQDDTVIAGGVIEKLACNMA